MSPALRERKVLYQRQWRQGFFAKNGFHQSEQWA